MHDNELDWRLASIERVLDCLPMYAARWASLSEEHRYDIRGEWALLCMHIDHIRWNWRRYSRGELYPDWWVMLELRIEEATPMLEYMELRAPVL